MNLEKYSILVTGGAGFIGSHIVEFLLKNGAKFVRVLDNLSTGSVSNINHLLLAYPNVEFIWGDITNLQTCHKACENITMICHQAALGSVPRSIKDPLNTHNSNINGFLNILLAARDAGIRRIVYASSSSVYGDNERRVKKENEIGNPLSPYAITKKVNELYAKNFSELYGLECIGLRYFNVFGPRQNPNSIYAAVIPKFIDAILKNEPAIINGDGTNSRDFTYVDNVVYANYLALTTKNKNCFGEVFNVGTNNSVSVKDLYYSICNILKKDTLDPIYDPPRVGDIQYSNASIDKIKTYLNYEPKVTFSTGLHKTINDFALHTPSFATPLATLERPEKGAAPRELE